MLCEKAFEEINQFHNRVTESKLRKLAAALRAAARFNSLSKRELLESDVK
jgi:hypothetical protein